MKPGRVKHRRKEGGIRDILVKVSGVHSFLRWRDNEWKFEEDAVSDRQIADVGTVRVLFVFLQQPHESTYRRTIAA